MKQVKKALSQLEIQLCFGTLDNLTVTLPFIIDSLERENCSILTTNTKLADSLSIEAVVPEEEDVNIKGELDRYKDKTLKRFSAFIDHIIKQANKNICILVGYPNSEDLAKQLDKEIQTYGIRQGVTKVYQDGSTPDGDITCQHPYKIRDMVYHYFTFLRKPIIKPDNILNLVNFMPSHSASSPLSIARSSARLRSPLSSSSMRRPSSSSSLSSMLSRSESSASSASSLEQDVEEAPEEKKWIPTNQTHQVGDKVECKTPGNSWKIREIFDVFPILSDGEVRGTVLRVHQKVQRYDIETETKDKQIWSMVSPEDINGFVVGRKVSARMFPNHQTTKEW